MREWAETLQDGWQEAWAAEEGERDMERRENGELGEDWEGEDEDEEEEDDGEEKWWKDAEQN